MKAKLEKISPNVFSSLAVKREVTPYMDYPFHFHPEFEVIFVEKSTGIRIMGNHIGHFDDGDLVFISSNLPHVWKNDRVYYEHTDGLFVDVYVIHFLQDALGQGFFSLPELSHIRRLFESGKQGILIKKGADHVKISRLIKKVYTATGFERLTAFLHTLHAFANATDYELLSSPAYAENSINRAETERINKVMDYLMENHNRDIRLDELADIAHMNKTSFCRYFKTIVHKTCTEFINELRITNACKMLTNSSMNVSEIAYLSGYNNISHFNRQFKLITGLSAGQYRKTIRS